MKESKSTYWALIIVGALAVLFSIFSMIKGKPFDTYFFSGFIGLIITVLGAYELLKANKKLI